MQSDASVLIIYSSFGDGHLQTALALRQSFVSMGISRVTMLDLFAEAHPRLNRISRFLYLRSAIDAPRLYGQLYRLSDRRPSRWFGRLFHTFGRKLLAERWRRDRPDIIVHTFPFLTADELRSSCDHGIPTFTVLTDYTLHRRWLHPGTTGYFVATESIRRAMINEGVPEHRIAVTGIPLREGFANAADRESLCRAYGFESSRRRVLLMAGAYGVQASIRLLIETALRETDCELIVVCGKNRKLRREAELRYSAEERVRILGYAERVHELMALSDCMLTKAGGITLTEALAMKLPTIVYRPLPGQEAGNADYLSGEGAIGVAASPEELALRLRQALDPAHAARMRAAMAAVRIDESARLIAREVLAFEGSASAPQRAATAAERKAVSAHV